MSLRENPIKDGWMAGKHQHHIWQLLQRGFSQRSFGDDHIWVYEQNTSPRKTVTRLFGEEKFFYGKENSKADKNISDFENSVQGAIQDARAADNGTELDHEIFAAIISHLEMRSSFLRTSLSHIGERLIGALKKYLSSIPFSPQNPKVLM
jgi:hypothetical protein